MNILIEELRGESEGILFIRVNGCAFRLLKNKLATSEDLLKWKENPYNLRMGDFEMWKHKNNYYMSEDTSKGSSTLCVDDKTMNAFIDMLDRYTN